MNHTEIATEVGKIAVEAGELLRGFFRSDIHMEYKGVADIVTTADTTSERFIVERVTSLVPDAAVLAEEGGGTIHQEGLTWIIDPLDGTTNFAHGFPWFSVSIALVKGVIPQVGVIYHPITRELFTAIRGNGALCNGKPIHSSHVKLLRHGLLTTGFYYFKGEELKRQIDVFEQVHQAVQTVRRPGSAAMDLAYVAGGFFDAFWEKGLSPWDIAAGILLVEEAGGTVTDYAGTPATVVSKEIAASNGQLHDELLALLIYPTDHD